MHYRDMELYETEADYMDPSDMIDTGIQVWKSIPPDIKAFLFQKAKQLYDVYGPRVTELVVRTYQKMRQRNIAALPALHLAAKDLNLPPRRTAPGSSGKLTAAQVKQRQQRMNQRLPSNRFKLSYKTRGY